MAINYRLQAAAIAPIMMNARPKTQPQRARTYGRLKTPLPMAHAHKEKIDPLTEPFSSLPNVLEKKGLF